jgi:hypothetical protein
LSSGSTEKHVMCAVKPNEGGMGQNCPVARDIQSTTVECPSDEEQNHHTDEIIFKSSNLICPNMVQLGRCRRFQRSQHTAVDHAQPTRIPVSSQWLFVPHIKTGAHKAAQITVSRPVPTVGVEKRIETELGGRLGADSISPDQAAQLRRQFGK